ncbi:MAG: YfaP family protein [Myxococcota bacterium]
MPSYDRSALLPWVVALACGGCSAQGGGEARASTSFRAEVRTDLRTREPIELEGAPEPAPNVTEVEPDCDGSESECNGLDDDCDGFIDEGCGHDTGPIQVTLAWSGGADLDLYVTDPLGETIDPTHRRSGTGGRLDRHGRGSCGRSPEATVENVRWEKRPPRGRFEVQVHYWGDCGSSAGPTEATVSVSVGGELQGVYRYALSSTERVSVVAFEIR